MRRGGMVLTVALVALWLVLNNSLSLGTLLLGVVLAVVLMLTIAQLRPVRPRVHRLHLAAPLAASVLIDIVRSNIAVARIALGLVRSREIRSGFLEIPLELTDPHALSILSAIVTSTPGTAWAGLSHEGRTLTLHVLDLVDEAHWIKLFKQRYERPLLRMFQ